MDKTALQAIPSTPMNLILLDSQDRQTTWSPSDPRAIHVRKVLDMVTGDSFFVGVENGMMGKARILADGEAGMALEVTLDRESPPPLPMHLLVGLPRPQVARRLLRELPSLGVGKTTFFVADKSEASYAQSSLWTGDEWKRLLREGAEQAFCTGIPKVEHTKNLEAAIKAMEEGKKVALDLYETTGKLTAQNAPGTLAIGPEGGWTNRERDVLRAANFEILTMGGRVMRVETAVIAAVAIVSSSY